MTDTELKNLKDNLWHSADILRAGAHLAANKYGQPILGLIFLRYADVLFKQHKAEGKHEEVDWLLERWPEGKYRDVIGLCKVAKITSEDGIEDNDWSLNAGRYVGVVIEDDGMTSEEFRAEMLSLNGEFQHLRAEAVDLQKEIEKNMRDLFGEE